MRTDIDNIEVGGGGNVDLSGITSAITALQSDVGALQSGLSNALTDNDLNAIRNNITNLQGSISTLQFGIAALQSGMADFLKEEDVADIRADVKGI